MINLCSTGIDSIRQLGSVNDCDWLLFWPGILDVVMEIFSVDREMRLRNTLQLDMSDPGVENQYGGAFVSSPGLISIVRIFGRYFLMFETHQIFSNKMLRCLLRVDQC